MKGPAVGELLGNGDHALTRELQLVLQTVLVLLGRVEPLHGLVRYREQQVAIPRLVRHFLHGILKDLVLLRRSVQGLHGFLVEIVNLCVPLGVLLACGSGAVPTISHLGSRNLSHSPAQRRSLSCHGRPHRPSRFYPLL